MTMMVMAKNLTPIAVINRESMCAMAAVMASITGSLPIAVTGLIAVIHATMTG
jgi:hypothetical protein